MPEVSPGIVGPDESLVRYLVTDHIEDTAEGGKTVKPNAFSHSGTNGMSVDRVRHRSKMRTVDVANIYIGYVVATCNSIREIQVDTLRCFVIYDTALVENPAHADICQCLFAPKSKSQQAKFRRRLKDAFDRKPILFEELSIPQTTNPAINRSMLRAFIDCLRSLWRRAKQSA